VFGRHVLVVWVGDFSGKSHPAFVGIDAAAPLFLRMVDALRAQGQAPGDIARPRPDDLQQVEVCAATGDLPDGVCPVKVKTWFIAGKSPIHISQLHASVQIDQVTGQVICDAVTAAASSQESRTILLERWGSDMQRIFDQSGLPRRQLDDTACEQNHHASSVRPAMAPLMRSPQRGVRYVLGPTSDPLTLRADAASGMKTLFWFADDSLIGQSAPGEPITWRPPSSGRYVLRVVDDLGQVDIRELDVDDPLSQAQALRLSN
jgi:penicillin-binding protein 1C